MLYGESGSNGELCRDSKKIKVPDVSMTPKIAQGSSGLSRMPSAVKRLVKGRSGGSVITTEGSMDDEFKKYVQKHLVGLIEGGYPPHTALAALQEADGDLESAAESLKAAGVPRGGAQGEQ